ncbi:Hypothetical predicted protein [Octopus vulgaris]|uniref:Uncharacterized protein n=1 Tax=Octopus vulgaris TaxID=6645 RepID=A0AA36BIK4_OCTVU|nr:Hypothetical predicted protein [Octopus vulgaris]
MVVVVLVVVLVLGDYSVVGSDCNGSFNGIVCSDSCDGNAMGGCGGVGSGYSKMWSNSSGGSVDHNEESVLTGWRCYDSCSCSIGPCDCNTWSTLNKITRRPSVV